MSISRLEEQLLQEITPIQRKEGYEEMVKIDADVDWEEMTDTSSINSGPNLERDDIHYRRKDVGFIGGSVDSAVFTAKALYKANEILEGYNRSPEIHYCWGKSESEGFLSVPEKDIQFTAQKIPYYDEDRLVFSLYLDKPSNYTNPRSKASFYSEFQQEVEKSLEELETSMNDQSLTEKILKKLK